IVSDSIFGLTMVLLYLASTLYHALPEGRAKLRFEGLDNAAIYLLIAGTYTPLTINVLGGAWGWTLLGVIWGLAAAGLVLTARGSTRWRWLSIGLYLGMGWLVLVVLRPLSARLTPPDIRLLFAGGVAYTAGLAFYAARWMRYNHLIWHLSVLVGTAC